MLREASLAAETRLQRLHTYTCSGGGRQTGHTCDTGRTAVVVEPVHGGGIHGNRKGGCGDGAMFPVIAGR